MKPHVPPTLFVMTPHVPPTLSVMTPHVPPTLSVMTPHVPPTLSVMTPHVHPCEKVIGMFFHNQIWSRLLDMNRLCLVCIKRSIDEVTKCQISKLGYHQRRSDEILKEARCQFCDVKFGHRVMEAVVFFDHGKHNFIQITLNVTNRWSKGVISWFSDIILHE